MKISEMNVRQKKAYKNVYHASRHIIGGLENTMQDNEEDSSDYIGAEHDLNNHNQLVETIYNEAISAVYDEGGASFNSEAKSHLKDIRFCGREWILERIEIQVKKLGY